MAKNLSAGQMIYVPSMLLADGDKLPHSIYRTEIVEVVDRSVRVKISGGGFSDLIASSKVQENLGIAIVSIGDFSTEDSLITPLTKSVLQFCRLLVPDDHLTVVKIRAIGELGAWWEKNHGAYTLVILIGHGSSTAITFGVGGERKPASFERRFRDANATPKTFISLCCETGRAPFAQQFSGLPFCDAFIAPFHSVHGAVASQFVQSFLSLNLLQAKSVTVAFKNALESVPGREKFRLWRNGKHVRNVQVRAANKES